MKKILLTLLVFSCTKKQPDQMTDYYNDWSAVKSSISQEKAKLKECKAPYLNELSEVPLMYKFNVENQKLSNIEVFADNYEMSEAFHNCVVEVLQNTKLTISKDKKLDSGYLMLTKDHEIFKTVLY